MGRRYHHLLNSIGVLRDPCDLDLVLFFYRHPRALLTSERLAAYVGYDLNRIARSLDLLTNAGLLERSLNPSHAARMYVLRAPDSGWLHSLLDIASTREGRCDLIEAMKEASGSDEAEDRAASESADAHRSDVNGTARGNAWLTRIS